MSNVTTHIDVPVRTPERRRLRLVGQDYMADMARHLLDDELSGDQPTTRHCLRVGTLAGKIAAAMATEYPDGYGQLKPHDLEIAGWLHDIGKEGMTFLRSNRGRLSQDEYRIMVLHAHRSYDKMQTALAERVRTGGEHLYEAFQHIAVMVLKHHSGEGYPSLEEDIRLAEEHGQDISVVIRDEDSLSMMGATILSVADRVDAISQKNRADRPHVTERLKAEGFDDPRDYQDVLDIVEASFKACPPEIIQVCRAIVEVEPDSVFLGV